MDARRAAVALLVMGFAVGLDAGTATAQATGERFGGRTRYETATLLSQSTHERSIQEVVLARGDGFPDALSASFAASHSVQYPILLTPSDALDEFTLQELRRLETGRVLIVGGEAAISPAVAGRLEEEGIEVARIAGADRYETARRTANSGEDGGQRTVLYLVSGTNFADAVAVGPAAYRQSQPIMLTPPDHLHPVVDEAIRSKSYETVVIVGGEQAVSAETEQQVEQACDRPSDSFFGDCEVRRLAGATRQETAIAVAEYGLAELEFDLSHVNLARGDDYPDALAGTPHGAIEGAPTLLTESPTELGAATRQWLEDHADQVDSIDVFGSPVAVSDEVWEEAKAAASSP